MTQNDSSDSNILVRIKSFLKAKIGMNNPEDAIFFENLEIAGLDCYSLMEEFGQEFNVDMSDFDPTLYRMGDFVINKWSDIVKVKPKKKFFDIYHLEAVATCEKWFDPS